WYRFRKLARQHKAGLATVAVVAVVGLAAVTGLTASNVLIRQAQQLAERRAEQIRQDLENLRHADALLERGRGYASERRWDDTHAAYTKAIAIRPDHASALVDRGTLYAHLGLWDLAAADYAGEFRLREPDTSARWFHLALLSVYLGDREGYHQVCRRMYARLGGTANRGFACELIRARVLAPAPGSDPAALVELGELVAASDPKLWYHHYLLGIARYRAGQHAGAIRHLRESIALFPAYPDLPQ